MEHWHEKQEWAKGKAKAKAKARWRPKGKQKHRLSVTWANRHRAQDKLTIDEELLALKKEQAARNSSISRSSIQQGKGSIYDTSSTTTSWPITPKSIEHSWNDPPASCNGSSNDHSLASSHTTEIPTTQTNEMSKHDAYQTEIKQLRDEIQHFKNDNKVAIAK